MIVIGLGFLFLDAAKIMLLLHKNKEKNENNFTISNKYRNFAPIFNEQTDYEEDTNSTRCHYERGYSCGTKQRAAGQKFHQAPGREPDGRFDGYRF
jgi:hypothetical protein